MFPSRIFRAFYSKYWKEPAKPYHLPTKDFMITKRILGLVGVWPFDSSIKNLIFRTCIHSCLILIIFLQVMHIMVTPKRSISFLIESFMYILPTLCGVSGYASMDIYNKELGLIFIYIKEFWAKMETKEELRMLQEHARDCRTYVIAISISVTFLLIAVSIQNLSPLLLDIFFPLNETRSYKLVVPIYIFFDIDKYYFLIYVLIIPVSITYSLVIISIYSTIVITSGHLNISLDVIGYILTNAFETAKGIDIEAKLIRAIKLHKTSLQYIDMLNSNWEATYSIQVGFGAIIAIIDLIQVFDLPITIKKSLYQAGIQFFYVLITLMCILISCNVGQKMLNASERFYETVCTLPLYKCPVKVQKLLILIIIKSKKECYMSVGKTYKISYELFSSIFRTATSIAMMIRSFQ